MNLVFLTLSNIDNISGRGIYIDLMRKFRDEGHSVYIVSPTERKYGKKTQLIDIEGIHILKVRTLNIQKTNVVEKGVGTLLIESQYKKAVNRFLKGGYFDLILYSTPPITFTNVVKFLKRKNPRAISYLLLKDIFPQNAVDLGMFGKNSIFYRYFRRKEVLLYKSSDYIGCMSPANVDFIRKYNPYYPSDRVEVAPNSIQLSDVQPLQKEQKNSLRQKYGLPIDRPVFIYGGNLGKPQGIDFLINCLDSNKDRQDCHFVVIGNGTEYHKLSNWYQQNKGKSVTLLERLPKADYDAFIKVCDVVLIFLDARFTIPNYPSRLLPYLENQMPIIAATDRNTDIGRIAEENGYGFWCESINPDDFTKLVDKMLQCDINQMGEKGYHFLCKNYLVEHTYHTIVNHIQ